MGERHERHEAPPTTVGVRFVVGAVLLMAGVVITDAPMMARAVTPVPVTSIATARENAPLSPARTLVPLGTFAVSPDGAAFATNTPSRPHPPTSTPASVRAATAAAVVFPPTATRPAPVALPIVPAEPTATTTTSAMGAPTRIVSTPHVTVAPTRPASRRSGPPALLPPAPLPASEPTAPSLPMTTPGAMPGTRVVASASATAAPMATATYANWPAAFISTDAPRTTASAASDERMTSPLAPIAVMTFAPPPPTVLFPPLATFEGARVGPRATGVPAASLLTSDGPMHSAMVLAVLALVCGSGFLALAGWVLWRTRRVPVVTRPLMRPPTERQG